MYVYTHNICIYIYTIVCIKRRTDEPLRARLPKLVESLASRLESASFSKRASRMLVRAQDDKSIVLEPKSCWIVSLFQS